MFFVLSCSCECIIFLSLCDGEMALYFPIYHTSEYLKGVLRPGKSGSYLKVLINCWISVADTMMNTALMTPRFWRSSLWELTISPLSYMSVWLFKNKSQETDSNPAKFASLEVRRCISLCLSRCSLSIAENLVESLFWWIWVLQFFLSFRLKGQAFGYSCVSRPHRREISSHFN